VHAVPACGITTVSTSMISKCVNSIVRPWEKDEAKASTAIRLWLASAALAGVDRSRPGATLRARGVVLA